MSFKRQATSELNHDNWDQEDPSENKEMGTFKTATKDVLEQRVIKTAKRRAIGSNNEEPKKSIFSGFGGFNKTQPTSFDFLSNLTKNTKSNGESTNETESNSNKLTSTTGIAQGGLFSTAATFPSSNNSILNTPKSSLFSSSGVTAPSSVFAMKATSTPKESPFKIKTNSNDMNKLNNSPGQMSSNFGATPRQGLFSCNSVPPKAPVSQNTETSQTVGDNQSACSPKKDSELELTEHQIKYYSKLKALNEAVSDWIKKHVEATPLCLLTPIFKDYDNHLREIQCEYAKAKKMASATENKNEQSATNTNSSSIVEKQPIANNTTTFFNSNVTTTSTQGTVLNNNNAGFSFGIKTSPNTTQSSSDTSGFSSKGKEPSPKSPFALATTTSGTAAPFSLGSTGSPPTTSPFALATNTTTSGPATPFSFGITASPKTTSPFALATNTTTSGSAAPFSFGRTASSPTTSPFALTTSGTVAPISFGIGKAFSFNANVQKPAETTEENDQDGDDEPPKVEYTPILEESSVYDKKCKIFVKKDGNFADKGVGTLYIKKIEDSEKHQLLVRANTNLGNVLLNFILSSSIPTQRMGKNNVMLVCIPTPDAKPPPTPILIRVKTSEEADELLETLNKFKA